MSKIPLHKIAGMLLATVLCLSMTIGMVEPGKASAAGAAAAPAIGVVDMGLLLNQHPDTAKANETLKAEAEAAQKEFETKSAGQNDKDKQALNIQLTQRVQQKRQELFSAIAVKINAAVKEVAEAKGLAIVLPKSITVYGGLDITDEVAKKLK